MSHFQTTRSATLLLLFLPAILALGCRSEEDRAADAFEEAVMVTLENTPDHLVTEVMRTCDKWKSIAPGRTCVESEVRQDQFECWLERGYPKLEHGYKYKLRQRTRDHTTLLKLDHCMEQRSWRLIKGRKETYAHIFGDPSRRSAAKP
jgi:hypothetical protein